MDVGVVWLQMKEPGALLANAQVEIPRSYFLQAKNQHLNQIDAYP